MGNVLQNFTFQDNATTVGNGNELVVNSGAETMIIEIEATSTAEFEFQAKLNDDSDWKDYKLVFNSNSQELVSVDADVTAFYQVDLTSLSGFRVALTANGGTTSIYGKISEG